MELLADAFPCPRLDAALEPLLEVRADDGGAPTALGERVLPLLQAASGEARRYLGRMLARGAFRLELRPAPVSGTASPLAQSGSCRRTSRT
jgi:hypothetical protein